MAAAEGPGSVKSSQQLSDHIGHPRWAGSQLIFNGSFDTPDVHTQSPVAWLGSWRANFCMSAWSI